MWEEKFISRRVLYERLCVSHGEIAKKLAYLVKCAVQTENERLLKEVKEIIYKYATERIERKSETESEFVMVFNFGEKVSEYEVKSLVSQLYKNYQIKENEDIEDENS